MILDMNTITDINLEIDHSIAKQMTMILRV